MTQTRFTPIKPNNQTVIRDVTRYPDTPQGEADLFAAIQNGTLVPIPAIPLNARIGTVRPPLIDNRTDGFGHSFETSTLPTQPAPASRLAPRRYGLSIPLAPQTAQFHIGWDRVSPSPISIHPSRKVVFAGPMASNAADNHYANFFNYIGDSSRAFVADPNASNKFRVVGDEIYSSALRAANKLQDSDARKPWLLDAGNGVGSNPVQHLLIDNEEACKLLAYELMQIVYQSDLSVNGCYAVSLDVEVLSQSSRAGSSGSRDAQVINMLAFTHKAMRDYATSIGKLAPLPCLYDAGDLAGIALYFADYDDGGTPAYTKRKNPVWGLGTAMEVNHILAQLGVDSGMIIGITNYQRGTYTDDSYWQKLPNGTYDLDADGNPKNRVTDFDGVIKGQPVKIICRITDSNDDPTSMLLFEYQRLQQMLEQQRMLGGGAFLGPVTKQSGFEKIQLQIWHRVDVEGLSGQLTAQENIAINQRPRNPQEARFSMLLSYLHCEVIRVWMQSQNTITTAGQRPADASAEGNTAKSGWEDLSAGLLDGTQLNAILDAGVIRKPINPRWWVKSQGHSSPADPLEHFSRKPIIDGEIVTFPNGKTKVWLAIRYPAQEVTDVRDVICWRVSPGTNTPVTPGYRMTWVGRHHAVDMFDMADGDNGGNATDWRFQFTDMLGNKQTWTGDCRDARITVHPTPPAVLDSYAAPTGSPSPTGAALTFGNVTYDGPNNKLKIPVNGLVGNVTYTISGVGIFPSQPTDGFTLTPNAINTLVSYSVKTDTQAQITNQLQCNSNSVTTTPTTTPNPPATGTNYFTDKFCVGPVVFGLAETNVDNRNETKRVLRTAKTLGSNLATLVMQATDMPFTTWAVVDELIQFTADLGYDIRMVLHLAPQLAWLGQSATDRMGALPSSAQRCKNWQGQDTIGPANAIFLSLYDAVALKYYSDTTELWINHMKAQPYYSAIKVGGFAINNTGEGTYDGDSDDPGTGAKHADIIGYDAAALGAWRNQMRNKFSTIGAYNSYCGTNFATFDTLPQPTPPDPNNVDSVFNGNQGSMFALHRAYGTRKFNNIMFGTMARLTPWTRLMDIGSYFDGQSVRRASTNPALITGDYVQARKANDDKSYNHKFSMSYARAGGLYSANEVDFSGANAHDGLFNDRIRMIRDSRAVGTRLCTLNSYNISDADLNTLFAANPDGTGRIADFIAGGPLNPAVEGTINLTLDQWTHLYNDSQQGQWTTLSANGTKFIDFEFESPVLTE